MSHAYLISTNNIDVCMSDLLDVIKKMLCYEKDSDTAHFLSHLIDINNLPSIKIIEPDGTFIKKDQVLELQYDFSKSSQYTDDMIYIIKNAEKMNKESANTILKFLEEPANNIIGFFITNHKDNIIPTILSRCQLININYDETLDLDDEIIDNIIKKYLYGIEVEKKSLILYNKMYLSELEKEKIISIFKYILKIYENHLNNELIDERFLFIKNYSNENIIKKINLLIEILKEINYNVNLDLLLDKFVIEMEGINNEVI